MPAIRARAHSDSPRGRAVWRDLESSVDNDSPEVSFSPLVPLAALHRVEAFACGDGAIDAFLRTHARAEQKLGLSQVYVSIDSHERVVAFFTLSPMVVRIEEALMSAIGMTTAPYLNLGGFLLGRLGVHTSIQGDGVGRALVMRAAQIARVEAAIVGGVFLAVDAKTERLVAWYETLGFMRLSARMRRLILPLHTMP